MTASNPMDGGDTAWVLVCAALVLFMVPGLAFFYAGMVKSRNTLVMTQQNFVALGVVTVVWILIGHSIAFGEDTGAGLFGDLKLFALQNLDEAPRPALHVVVPGIAIPTLAFVAYQMMFAIITPALITGATADRLKIAGWVVILAVWPVVVYAPIAHWLFDPEGWLAVRGAQDWAGGMVVHASAGAAALAILLVVGRRTGWPGTETVPHSVPLAMIGAGILWFGWFGFNAGDGLQANGIAAQALINTHVAAAAGMVIWSIAERFRQGRSTVVGAATGAVAGLATITPCAGYVDTASALLIGAVAGLVCQVALGLKVLFRFDDALDVIAVHFVGGVLGSLLLGLFGKKAINGIGADGLFFGGGFSLLGNQALAVVAVVAFSFVVTLVIAFAADRTVGLRLPADEEFGSDRRRQGMDAYRFAPSFVAGAGLASGAVDEPPLTATRIAAAPSSVQYRLVTVLVRAIDAGALESALREAGARSIVVTEVHAPSTHRDTVVMRDQRSELALAQRLKVEVLVRDTDVERVLDALDSDTIGGHEGYVQQAAEPLSPQARTDEDPVS
ncbi:ammonium transporter [Prescottella equi]|uniref:ammonium transporter n=1 Tax=Rhodococcus hoagii TaxID=43767 RepID=UPI000A104566|nr:ammonium transporter [Prescottella equi]ORL37717.1 ammonium transporter [Prescottella equi]ORM08588.1 ammonium transporter [Prescottella equi]UNQ37920.1 ammonium transporter [Prescottella equi]BCN49480.1 hypothetical protein RE9416_27810 [Prescottella equi]